MALSACTIPAPLPRYAQPHQPPDRNAAEPDRLAAELADIGPDSRLLTAAPVGTACGTGPVPVVSLILGGPVLFASDSDRPAPNGAPVLDAVAERIRRDTPGWHLTVLGHTDAIGSDAYNMDLSRRRAAKVLRALVDRGLDPSQLSAVAIGKRQPIADNRTEAGRARNRRVEFLVSRCLDANLDMVRQNGGTGSAQVLRLDQDYRLAAIGSVALRPLTPPAAAAPVPLHAGPSAAHLLPPPHYQPNMLAPEAQPSPLRAPVPY